MARQSTLPPQHINNLSVHIALVVRLLMISLMSSARVRVAYTCATSIYMQPKAECRLSTPAHLLHGPPAIKAGDFKFLYDSIGDHMKGVVVVT